jgi:hypothetical protein
MTLAPGRTAAVRLRPAQGLRTNVETQICLKSQLLRQENRC